MVFTSGVLLRFGDFGPCPVVNCSNDIHVWRYWRQRRKPPNPNVSQTGWLRYYKTMYLRLETVTVLREGGYKETLFGE